VITLSGAARRGRGHAIRGESLGGASIQTFKNAFFSRNLGQNMPKNAYILEKDCKIAAPEPPLASGAWDSALRPLRC